jgi:hypothetical protein
MEKIYENFRKPARAPRGCHALIFCRPEVQYWQVVTNGREFVARPVEATWATPH